jgi:predicted O-linked N-acetylglucosamine transferase (SPINDLY family)
MVNAFEKFHDVSASSDREVAAMLRDLEADIVVDLNGHTSGGRPGIFAFHPAPVQVNYLGYPGTSGADYMDYVIADSVVIPSGDESFYVEKVVRLPHSYLPYDNGRPATMQTPTRQDAGLPEKGFVFCAFNNSFKINPAMFDVWMRILGRIPESVLWLRSSNGAMQRNLGREAEARGIAADRLVFAPRIPAVNGHLARHQLADLFLDTLPYNAHSTAADALWAGLPVLTCSGSAFAGRVAASLLRAAGLPDLITRNLDEYEAQACSLAVTPSVLAGIRSRLAANRTTCPLFDTDRYCRELESAYITMWERSRRGDAPASFSV